MENNTQLPTGYTQILHVDMQKDKKLALLVNGLCLVIAVLMFIAAAFFVPIQLMFDFSDGMAMYWGRLGVVLIGMLIYIVLHEAVHGIFMKLFSGIRPKYGFTGLYAYAGSDAYFGKKHYIIIALAPVVILGAVLAALNLVCPTDWFWVIYFLQVINISGAAGDYYVTYKFSRFPSDILVHDTGVAMTVYSSTNADS